jgi:hypothetical protein
MVKSRKECNIQTLQTAAAARRTRPERQIGEIAKKPEKVLD